MRLQYLIYLKHGSTSKGSLNHDRPVCLSQTNATSPWRYLARLQSTRHSYGMGWSLHYIKPILRSSIKFGLSTIIFPGGEHPVSMATLVLLSKHAIAIQTLTIQRYVTFQSKVKTARKGWKICNILQTAHTRTQDVHVAVSKHCGSFDLTLDKNFKLPRVFMFLDKAFHLQLSLSTHV